MSHKRKIIVLGTHSFTNPGIKVGIQFIAEHFAELGHEVTYISNPSSPVDMLVKRTYSRFKNAWLKKDNSVKVNKNLTELTIKAPWTSSKLTFKYNWQIPFYGLFLPKDIKKTEFDLLIHDSSTTAVLLEKIKTKHKVYRINDTPRGFESHFGKTIANWFDSRLQQNQYDEIWASSQKQLDEGLKFNEIAKGFVIPNGYNAKNYQLLTHKKFDNTAVFIGAISDWIDFDLMEHTAEIMPDWTFYFFGPDLIGYSPQHKNIKMMGALDNKLVTSTISKMSVGIIPYKNTGHVVTIERPIKFYEYTGAHLGVAVTEIESFKKGMDGFAFFGSEAKTFSKAIIDARKFAQEKEPEYFQGLVDTISWDSVFKKIDIRLEHLWK